MYLDQAILELKRRTVSADALIARINAVFIQNYEIDLSPPARVRRRDVQRTIALALGLDPKHLAPAFGALVRRVINRHGVKPVMVEGRAFFKLRRK